MSGLTLIIPGTRGCWWILCVYLYILYMASAAAQIFRRHHRHGSGAELHIRLIDADFRAVLGRVLADSDPDHAGGS